MPLLLIFWMIALPVYGNADEVPVVQKIEFSGLKYSNERVLLRELPFSEGSRWQSDFIKTSERRLRNLGIFTSKVTVLPPDNQGIVHIIVKDRWPIWLLPEATRKDGGASRAGLALTDYNLWGLNHFARFSGSVDTGKNFSSNQGQSYQGSYIWRRATDSKYSIDMSVNRGNSVFDTFKNGVLSSSYVQNSQDWALGLSYAFDAVPGEGWGARLGLSHRLKTFTLKAGAPQPDIQNNQRDAVSLGVNYLFVDDHTTWITGSAFNYNVEIANSLLGSTINIVRQSASWRSYIPLKQQDTINVRVNAGWADGDLLRDGLFDLGGGEGFRGYYPGDLQGSAYIYGTVESRMLIESNSNVQWVAFVDVGHVANQGHRALGRSVVAGVGTGMRWTLRWLVNGTFRGDVAYSTALHRWRLHLGTGQAF
ncbi:MAG: BamA/TamA family outer membrane protein [Mariprofundaceae bacterium]|nr:BamA/TamA family outer membrane protein [Mariprofundaceae bacterium]